MSNRQNNVKLSKYHGLISQHLNKLNDELDLQIQDLHTLIKTQCALNSENEEKLKKLKVLYNHQEAKCNTQNSRLIELGSSLKQVNDYLERDTAKVSELEQEIRNAAKQEGFAEDEVQHQLNSVNGRLQEILGHRGSSRNEKASLTKSSQARTSKELQQARKEQDIKNSQLKVLVEDAKDNVATISQKIRDDKRKLSKLKSNLSAIREDKNNAERTKSLNYMGCEKLKKLINDCGSRIIQLQAIAQSETENKNKASDELIMIKAKSAQMDEDMRRLNEEITELKKDRNEKVQRINELEEAMDNTMSIIASRRRQIDKTRESIRNIQMESKKLKEHYTTLQEEKIAKAEKELSSQLAVIKADISKELEKQNDSKLKADALEEDCKNLSDQMEQEITINENLKDTLSALEAQISTESSDNVKQLEQEKFNTQLLKRLQRNFANVTSKVDVIRNANDYCREAISVKKNEISAARDKLESYNVTPTFKPKTEEELQQTDELRVLKRLCRTLQKQVQIYQKELELCALRRDNAVDKAKAIVPTQYQVRSQAVDEIQKVQQRVKNLCKASKSLQNAESLH